MHLPVFLCRCLWQWADYANTATDLAGKDCSNPSLRLCHSFQVSYNLYLVFFVWSVNIGTPSLQVHAVMNRIQTLCVIAGKTSLSLCIRPMWSCSRASSCSTLRTSETCFRWSSLLIQIQTHGFRAEVCSASLTSTTMSVTLVEMFTAQPVSDKCEYHFIHKKPTRTTVLGG